MGETESAVHPVNSFRRGQKRYPFRSFGETRRAAGTCPFPVLPQSRLRTVRSEPCRECAQRLHFFFAADKSAEASSYCRLKPCRSLTDCIQSVDPLPIRFSLDRMLAGESRVYK